MSDVYQKFKEQPPHIQEKLNSQETLDCLDEIEEKFPQDKVSLAYIVMAVAVGDLKRSNLGEILQEKYKIEKSKALAITENLEEKIFVPIFGSQEKKVEEKKVEGEKVEEKRVEKKEVEEKGTEEEILFGTKEEKEEEEEIKKIKKDLDKESPLKLDFEQILEKIIQDHNLSFTEERLKKRLANIISSFLRDIRGEIETKETLTKSGKIGGMEYSSELADNIIKDLKNLKPSLKNEAEKKKPDLTEKPFSPQPLFTASSEEKPEPQPPKPQPVEKQGPTTMPEEKVSQALKDVSLAKESLGISQLATEKKEEEKKPKISSLEPSLTSFRQPSPEKEKAGDEIKVTPKIYGPFDELRTLKLSDWRRWGTPQEAASRILEKINILQEESLTRGAKGKEAWRESEVYRLYLDIGTEAMDKDLPIETIIKKREEEGRPFLTKEEFEIIGELNHSLRF